MDKQIFRSKLNIWENLKPLITVMTAFTVVTTIFVLKEEESAKMKNISFAKVTYDCSIEEQDKGETVFIVKTKTTDIEKFFSISKENIEVSLVTDSQKDIQEIVEEITPEMDISMTSGISKSDFIYSLENCKYDITGILRENADIIWEECQQRELNEFAVVGIIATESCWANPDKSELVANKKNIMSIKNDNGEYKRYDTYTECILDAIRLLSEEYVSEEGRYHTGGQLDEIASTYSENGIEWANLVAECAEMSTRGLQEEEG